VFIVSLAIEVPAPKAIPSIIVRPRDGTTACGGGGGGAALRGEGEGGGGTGIVWNFPLDVLLFTGILLKVQIYKKQ
jgi:hypothetical protein